MNNQRGVKKPAYPEKQKHHDASKTHAGVPRAGLIDVLDDLANGVHETGRRYAQTEQALQLRGHYYHGRSGSKTHRHWYRDEVDQYTCEHGFLIQTAVTSFGYAIE